MAHPTETSPLLPAEPASERPHPGAVDARPPVGPRPPVDRKAASSPSPSLSSSSSAAPELSDTLRDVIIGFSDGLTVPFALTAGLSSLGSTRLVVMGGLAELFSGMISMGLGAYLAAATERDRHRSQLRRLRARDAAAGPADQRADLFAILDRFAVSRDAAAPLVDDLCADRRRWLRFKMAFDMPGAADEPPPPLRAWLSGATMGLSYLVGGLVPMLPYFALARVRDALLVSVAVTLVTLVAFGYAKNYVAIRNHRAGLWGALQTLVIGILAAGTSYAIVKALDAGGS